MHNGMDIQYYSEEKKLNGAPVVEDIATSNTYRGDGIVKPIGLFKS
jgi:hypothetical protein